MNIVLPTQTHCGARPDPDKFEPVSNRDFPWGKPVGGYWTSSRDTLMDDGWEGWCRRESYAAHGHCWVLQPLSARVYEIRNADDVIEIHERYGLRHANVNLSTRPDGWDGLDWEAIARDYDAVRLVDPYAEGIRFNRRASSFYGWDCESTVWLRWMFAPEVERLELPTHVDNNEDAW